MKIEFEGTQNKNFLVIDAESVAHRAYWAFTRKDFQETTATGLYKGCFLGFFMMWLKTQEMYQPEDIVFCWGDNRENLIRRQMCPSYKVGRKEKPSELLPQIEDIQKSIELMGFDQYTSDGYEGDDVVATIVKKFSDKIKLFNIEQTSFIYILSNDKDIRQLITERIKVIEMTTGFISADKEHNKSTVKDKFGVFPEQLSDYLCLVGDKSDGIEGINQIGPKTAEYLLNTFGPIKSWFDKIPKLDCNERIKDILYNARKQMILNKKLVTLTGVQVPLKKIKFKETYNSIDEIFNKYEMYGDIRPHRFLKL